MMRIEFKDIGENIGTRVIGERLRKKIEIALSSGQFVIFDFDGVKVISHSFADECFGKLLDSWSLDELKTKSTFQSANPHIKKVISFTFKERISNKLALTN